MTLFLYSIPSIWTLNLDLERCILRSILSTKDLKEHKTNSGRYSARRRSIPIAAVSIPWLLLSVCLNTVHDLVPFIADMSSEDKSDWTRGFSVCFQCQAKWCITHLFIPVQRRWSGVENGRLNDLLDPKGNTWTADEMKPVRGNAVTLGVCIPSEYSRRQNWQSLRGGLVKHWVLVFESQTKTHTSVLTCSLFCTYLWFK